MDLDAFSLSPKVKHIAISYAFYEGLGFFFFGGAEIQGWLISTYDCAG